LWLTEQGAKVRAHDPAIPALPDSLANKFTVVATPLDALDGASAVVVATEWSDYCSFSADQVLSKMTRPIVIDSNQFLSETLGNDHRIGYMAVGRVSI
jgi:UDPglucose 6-dehydrogenase